MTTELETHKPRESPLKSLRADHKAERRWRMHEVQGRMLRLETKVDRLTSQMEEIIPKLFGLLGQTPPAYDAKALPEHDDGDED